MKSVVWSGRGAGPGAPPWREAALISFLAMTAEKLRLHRGPRHHVQTKHYGKFRVDVEWLPTHRILVYAMDGFIGVEHIDDYVDDLLAVAAEKKPVGMIADPRNMKVLSAEFQKAVQTRFWPGIAKLGVKRNPAIVPPAVVTQTSVKRMVATMGETVKLDGGGEMQIALLESLDECIEWITR